MGMIRAVRDLGDDFSKKGWPPIAVGVGVSSGNMNVGNMGSEFRIAYTVLGDTVNVAFRLNDIAGTMSEPILISAETAKLIKDSFKVESLGNTPVEGRKETVDIFRVVP